MNEQQKISIRFFDDREVRALWDEQNAKWWFSVLDIVSVLTNQDDYTKTRNYWKYLKAKLKKKGSQVVSATTQLKFLAPDGKKRLADMLDYNGIIALGKTFPGTKANKFIEWFTYSNESIDGKSKTKAYALFESSFVNSIEVGTAKGLQQIHAYLFGGLYDFAGQIRTKSISKGDYQFTPAHYLETHLAKIEAMPETNLDEIVDKYCAMNIAHPFMEGNGRSTRVWLDLILKKRLKKCVDWSKISKNNYMNAMIISTVDSSELLKLIKRAVTTDINSREMFMKGIDYSYYYEEN
ncbi:MAG: cell filamentation protein Fic [Sphingobacteriia bacterium]|nr:MAG: cell filamentation protein Fic [Sphingobacteriia bacterium]TAG30373.1 MAG: cell filamentation protein Fic [Sphingobacteriia bacterium]TAH08198.1 MAG: cell filamentation protein Fic [Sphingobacteriia bacterium]